GAPVTTYSEVTGAVSLTKATDPACMRIAALSAIIVSLIGKVGAAIQTIPQAVLGGIMLLLFGSIAAVGINNMVKAKIDMNKTRNLIIASIILTVGIGGAVISFGKFSLAGIGLASIVGVILNLLIPDKDAESKDSKQEQVA
ncbi:MAG: uracil permease, partial [Bacteroidales bacterium]|nr:uracil permease [Bacteroidales bacterium]